MKRLLLHTCCAPCLTVASERLMSQYELTVFWSNPNIYPDTEWEKRLKEVQKLTQILKLELVIAPDSEYKESWDQATIAYADNPEGGTRCSQCQDFRLDKAAAYAQQNGFDGFATTLSTSPHKNARVINELGDRLAQEYKTQFLPEDFKKNNGFLRSIELSKIYNLYRQCYCGCVYSLKAQ